MEPADGRTSRKFPAIGQRVYRMSVPSPHFSYPPGREPEGGGGADEADEADEGDEQSAA